MVKMNGRSCQKVGRFYSLQVNWLVEADEWKNTTKTWIFARSSSKGDELAYREHLALLSGGDLLARRGHSF